MTGARWGLTLSVLAGIGAAAWLWPSNDETPMGEPATAAVGAPIALPAGVSLSEEDDGGPTSVPVARVTAGGGNSGGADIQTVEVAWPPDYEAIFRELGIERDLDAWFKYRGRIADRSVTGAYDALPRGELRRLSDEGDNVARWVLARKVLFDAPLEANALLRDLAEEGEIDAVQLMVRQVSGLARHGDRLAERWSEDRREAMAQWQAAGTDLRTEAMAWGLLYELYRGRPRGTFVDRAWNENGEPPPELAEACERAAALKEELEAAWASAALDGPGIEAAPVVPSTTPDDAYLAACPEKRLPTPSFMGCRPFRIEGEDDEQIVFACPGG